MNYVFYLLGMIVSSLGIICFIQADVGVGTTDSVAIGLSSHIPVTVGIGMMFIHIIVISLNTFLSKTRPELFVFVPILLRGVTVDFWNYIIPDLQLEFLLFRWLLLVVGLVLMGVGLGMYLHTSLPKIPVDDLIKTLMRKNHWSLRVNRIMYEFSLLFTGFILGGPIGIGTFVISLCLGPSIQFFYQRMENIRPLFNRDKAYGI
ncbi:YitT family protein [Pontibacillus salicampi]|uniref:YitT family protein n=1 Tax=Pontibacillus salicampi TaxID=1449801 RepID=A0ABV6LLK6_9BACI